MEESMSTAPQPTPTVTTSAHVVSFQEDNPGLKQTNVSATTTLLVSEKKKQQSSPAPQQKSEALKTKVSVNQKQQHVGPSQKIVIDVKTEAPQPQLSTAAKPSVTLGPNEKSSNSNGRKAKISAENKIKREISLVLEPTPKKCSGYVGFANLPNQVYRKAVKKGFDFTLMVVGESGLGKSTLINSMFLTDIYGEAAADPASTGNPENPNWSTKLPQTLNIQEQKVKLVENDVHLALTVVDTPGFGDAVNNADCWSPVINYVERQFDKYLDAETRVERFPVVDSRVHACLYFIAPTGHTLKPLDIEFMRRIHQRVNIIPVIGKADTLTPEELICFKQQIMKQIAEAEIKIYQFPQEKAINAKLPFAVVGSNCVLEENGEKIRGRKYPWGVVNIESLEHCDFLSLRDMLIRTHLQDLKERTSDTLYENYRCLKLSSCCKNASHSPIKELEDEKKEHEERLLKMEKEMEEVFDRKVREKEKKLNETEMELRQKLKEAQEKLDEQREDLEEKMAAYDKERLAWSRMYGVSVEELSNWDEKRKTGKSVTLNGVKFRIGR